ncbi:MAG: RNA polymerase factor sigma-54, partial [Pseudomonadota bacterium]
MKASLQLKMGQQLTMTPQLQQAIRLLQLSTLDLQQEIQEALDSNPMLENEEPGSDDFGDTPSDNNADNNTDNGSNADEQRRDDSLNEYSASAGDNSDDYSSNDDYNNSDSGDEASTPDNQEVGDHLSNEQLPDDLPVDSNWDDTYQPTAGVASGSGPID